jgi:hypothetical protein
MPAMDSGVSLVRFGPCPLHYILSGTKTESAGFSESLDAVANNDRDRAHGDRDRRTNFRARRDACAKSGLP